MRVQGCAEGLETSPERRSAVSPSSLRTAASIIVGDGYREQPEHEACVQAARRIQRRWPQDVPVACRAGFSAARATEVVQNA